MISYSQYGKHYGFEGGDSLSDIQNKAQKLRKKGFTIDKMGRYNPPVDAKLRTGKTGVVEEKEEPKKSIEAMKDKTSTETKEKDVDKIKLAKEKDTDTLEKQLIAAQGQINQLRTKLENEKNKAVKPMPNKETGEVPLTVGLAHKLLKDKADKEKDEVKESVQVYRVSHPSKKTWEVEGKNEKEAIRRYKDEVGLKSDAGIKTLLIKDVGEEKKDPCWKDYEMVGTKMKDGKEVPNCVPKNEAFSVQITKMDGGKFIHGTYKTKAEAEKFIKWYKTGDLRKTKKIAIVKETFKSLRNKLQEATPDPIKYGPDKVAKAMKIAVKSDGNYSGAVREIEKIARDLSKVSTIAKALKTANEDVKEGGPGSGPREGDTRGTYKTGHKKTYMKPGAGARPGSAKDGGQTDKEADDYDTEIGEACWDGYTKVGMKNKGGKQVPNCVPDKDNKIPKEKKQEEKELDERGGANTSTRQGSFAKSRKPKYRFGYRVAEKEPEGGKKLKEIRIRPKRAVESDLTKSQVKKVHKKADELPKKSFRDQYGKKKGDSVRYAVATNQTKKKLGIENKNHPAKKKWETLVAKKAKKESDNNTDILPKSQEPTQKTDPMNIQTKEPEKKKTDNGTKSDKIDVNPRIDYHA